MLKRWRIVRYRCYRCGWMEDKLSHEPILRKCPACRGEPSQGFYGERREPEREGEKEPNG